MASSCDACGWAAAFCSMLAFGTFGVPIKSPAARKVDVDPLVMQSYKTMMCFVTSWLILLAGEEFRFTPWGIVSGLFWVPGGVATIYAVKSVGLAVGIGVGSSFIVLVSFFWGIFIFEEHVHSKFGAVFAVFCMMLGLMGMSWYSSPEKVEMVEDDDVVASDVSYRGLRSADSEEDEEEDGPIAAAMGQVKESVRTVRTEYTDSVENDDDEPTETIGAEDPDEQSIVDEEHTVVFGVKVRRRTLGICAAAFCGIWGGSIMVPMQYSPADAKGTHYLISFSIGASIVTVSLWIVRYLINYYHYQSAVMAYEALPSFHLRTLWLAGGTCGLLWSIGNFFSLISVFYLGEGVGYPLVQTSILVSGLWGIFYFKEVKGAERISKWLASSLLTIFGILLLSYEHHEK